MRETAPTRAVARRTEAGHPPPPPAVSPAEDISPGSIFTAHRTARVHAVGRGFRGPCGAENPAGKHGARKA